MRVALLIAASSMAAGCHAGGPLDELVPSIGGEERGMDEATSGDGWLGTEGSSGNGRPPVETRCSGIESPHEFVDVSECAGLDATHTITDFEYYAIGQAWGDWDRDGWLDLYVTDMDGPNVLYRNRGDGTFERAWESLSDVESAGAVFVDFDNDGWSDLYVLNRGANALYRNEGGDGFADVTERAGVGDPHQGQGAAWGDFDGDGWLDLYVVNWMYYGSPDGSADVLYRNDGDGTFTDVTSFLDPTTITGAGFVASFVDHDDDGDLDLYVANDKGYPGPPEEAVTNRNVLFRNDGPGCAGWCFTEIGETVAADVRRDAMGLATGDYDNDGDLDFFITDSPLASVLLQNRGDGTFVDVAEDAGVWQGVGAEWGTAFLDYDRDGFLDLYVASEGPSRLFHNRGDGTFDDVSEVAGLDHPLFTLGVAYGDYDRDGRVDLVTGERGWGYHLHRNTGRSSAGRRWLTVRLEGGGPVNRDAIGARVTVHTSDGRSLLREVKCGSSLGAGNDIASYFGLGAATPREVEIRWPDGTVERRSDVPVDSEVMYRYGG